MAQLKGWGRADTLYRLITELKKRSDADPGDWAPEGVKQRISWAEGMTRRFDPFRNGYFPSALQDKEADADLDCDQQLYW